MAVKQRLNISVVPWIRVNSGSLGSTAPLSAWHSLQDCKSSPGGVRTVRPIADSANPEVMALSWLRPGPWQRSQPMPWSWVSGPRGSEGSGSAARNQVAWQCRQLAHGLGREGQSDGIGRFLRRGVDPLGLAPFLSRAEIGDTQLAIRPTSESLPIMVMPWLPEPTAYVITAWTT